MFQDSKESYWNSRAPRPWAAQHQWFALHWRSMVHASAKKSEGTSLFIFQEVHKERIALETQLEQLRPVTVLWPPAGRAAAAELVHQEPCYDHGTEQLRGDRGDVAGFSHLLRTLLRLLAFADEEGTESKHQTVGCGCLPSPLPLPSLTCKCGLPLKWVT